MEMRFTVGGWLGCELMAHGHHHAVCCHAAVI